MRALRFGRPFGIVTRERLVAAPRRTYRPALELLEDRLAPAALNWIGAGATNAWSDSGNWRDAGSGLAATPTSGDSLTFSTTAVGWNAANAFAFNSNNDLNNLSLVGLAVNDTNTTTGNDFTINGNAFTLTGNITHVSNATTTIGLAALNLGASINLTNTSGAGGIALRSTIDLGSFNLTVSGAGTGTISVGTFGNATQGVISGSGQLIMSAAGTLGLAGPSIYTGGTILNSGSLVPSVNAAFTAGVLTSGAFGTGTLTINGGTLRATTAGPISVGNDLLINNSFTIPSAATNQALTFTGDVDLGGATRTLTVSNVAGVTFTGAIGNGTLVKAGTSTVVLSGTHTGDVTVSAGTLHLTANAVVAGNITVQPGAVLRLDAATVLAPGAQVTLHSGPTQLAMLDVRYDGALPILTANSSGVVALGSGTYSQAIDLAALGENIYLGASVNTTFTGSLAAGAGNAYRLGGGGGQLAIASALLGGTNRLIVGASEPNSSVAAVNGSGTVILLSGHSYTGGTTISGGSTLVIGAGGANTPLGTGDVTVYGSLIAAGASGAFVNAAGTANTNGIILKPGSVLRFDNRGAYQGLAAGNNDNRWADNREIALDGSTLELLGQNAAAGTSETVGAITFDKGSTVSIKRGSAGTTTLTAASLTRVNQGTLALIASAPTTLGSTDRFIVTTAPPRGTAANGATVNMVAPYIVNVSNAGTNISYVDYDPTAGFKDVVYKTVSTLAGWDTVTETDIVDVTNPIAAVGLVKTVYAIRATAGASGSLPGLSGTATITTTSGGLIYGSLGSSPTWDFVFGAVAAPGEALVWLNTGKNPVQSGTFTANGLTLTRSPQGAGGATPEELILTGNHTATLTGTITVNSGILTLRSDTGTNAPAIVSNAIVLNGGTLRIRNNGIGSSQTIVYGNHIIVHADSIIDVNRQSGTTAASNTVQFGNLTIGNAALTVTGGNSYAVRINGTTTLTGDATLSHNTTLTLNGVIGDGGLGFGLTKAGAGTLNANAANTYGGATVIAQGILELTAAGGSLLNSDKVVIGTIFGQSATLRVANAAAVINVANGISDGPGVSNLFVDRGTLNVANGLTVDVLRVALEQAGITGTVTARVTVSSGAVVIGDGISDLDIARMTSNSASVISGTLDLAGAISVVINVGNLRLGTSTIGGGAGTSAGTLLLSAAGLNQVTAASVVVGDVGDTGNSNVGVTNRITLGTGMNRFRVDELYVSRRKSVGIVSFATPTSGGTFDLAGKTGAAANLFVGDNTVTSTSTSVNGTGTVDLTGGTFNATLGQVVLGRYANVGTAAAGSGSGTLTMTAGTLTATSVLLAQAGVSTNATGNVGVLHVNGGTLTAGTVTLGQARGRATVNVAGGTLNVGTLSFAPTNAVGTATLNLSSGTLAAAGISQTGAGTVAFNWTGGTLRNQAGADLLNTNVSIAVTGADLHTLLVDAGRTVTLQAALTGAAAFTKDGAGLLILQANSTAYAGAVTVAAGTLLASNAAGSATGSNTVTVQNGGTLGGTGAIAGAVTIQSGGRLTAADVGTTGILTINNLTLNSGAVFLVDIGGASPGSDYDQVLVGGTADLAAQPTLQLAGTFAATVPQTFTILQNPSGNFLNLPEGQTLTFNGVLYAVSYLDGAATLSALAPSVTEIVRTTPHGPLTNAASVTYTVTFTNSVTGVDAGDFLVVTTGGIAYASPVLVSGSGTTYTVTINGITGTGTLGLNLVDDDSIVDQAGNALPSGFTGQVYDIDQTAPTVQSIVCTTPPGPLTNAASVTYTVTFSSAVLGVDASDFEVVATGGATYTSQVVVSGSSATYTVTVNGISGTGTLGLNLLDDDSITDLAGNTLAGGFTGAVYDIDQTAPTVQSVVRTTPAGPLTNADSVTYTVTFSSIVLGVDASDFQVVTTGGVTFTRPVVVSGSGSTYTVTVSGISGTGTLGLNLVDDGSIADLAGNALTGGLTGEVYDVDQTAPIVQGIVRTTPPGPLTDADAVTYTVTFSTDVAGVDASDFLVVTTGGVSFTSPVVVSGSGSSYTVTVAGISGTGTLGLNLVDDGSIQDQAGNTLVGGFTGQVYDIDQTAPTVQGIVRTTPAGPSTNAPTVTFTVTFSSDVTGVDVGDFQVVATDGVTFTSPVAVSGSGNSYTVSVTGISGTGTLGLNLVDDGSIQDLAGNALAGGFTGQVYTIDRVAPLVSIDTFPPNPSASASAAFTFSASDVGSGVSELRYQLDNGNVVVVAGPSGRVNFANVPSGMHTFTVTAVDQAGNTAVTTYTWLINIPTATVGIYDAATATWYLRNANTSGAPDFSPFSYGWGFTAVPQRGGGSVIIPGTTPVVGDWDGDGDATIGAYDPHTATWYLRNSNSPGAPDITPFSFGFGGAIPVVGDWDGNGTVTIGLYDPRTATWYLRNSNSPGASDITPFSYGFGGAIPVVGDWDGDGDTNIGIYHPGTAQWFLRDSNGPGAPTVPVFAYGFGSNPVVGDWDGDGRATIGIYNPGTAQWFLRNTNSAGAPTVPVFAYGFGSSPVVGDWNFPAALHAGELGTGTAGLTNDALAGAAAGALERLRLACADAAWLARLGKVQFEVAYLDGTLLGLALADQGRVLIDADAAGHGWFIDPTPLDDVEFAGSSIAVGGRLDLLSAVLHELGHIAGLEHGAGAMAETLEPGARALAALDALFARD